MTLPLALPSAAVPSDAFLKHAAPSLWIKIEQTLRTNVLLMYLNYIEHRFGCQEVKMEKIEQIFGIYV